MFLDLGCGEGHFLKLLLTTMPELNAVGVELIEEAAARARDRLQSFQATIVTNNLVQFLQSDLLAQRPYDLVVLGEVLYFGVKKEQIDFVVRAVADILSPKRKWYCKLIISVHGPIALESKKTK